MQDQKSVTLERFSSTRSVSGSLVGDFYFHPGDENLSPSAPERKKPLIRSRLSLQQLGNRYRAISLAVAAKIRAEQTGRQLWSLLQA
jgi:hypothetical protein